MERRGEEREEKERYARDDDDAERDDWRTVSTSITRVTRVAKVTRMHAQQVLVKGGEDSLSDQVPRAVPCVSHAGGRQTRAKRYTCCTEIKN